MAGKKAAKATEAKAKRPATRAQVGAQLTWQLLGCLKRTQLQYLHVGELLTRVRDEKLYIDLKYPDMLSYARERLNLGRTSLNEYLNVYGWVRTSHPEWLAQNVRGDIPDLSDVGDLMWIEGQLKKKRLTAARRRELEALRKKGLEGELRREEVDVLRHQQRQRMSGLTRYASSLRRLRKQGARLAGMPAEVLEHLDRAIGVLANAKPGQLAGLSRLRFDALDYTIVPDKKTAIA